MALAVQSCGLLSNVRIANETQIVKVPLLYCPAPPNWQRPVTEIERENLERASDGDIVKAYVATVKELQGYVVELETIIKSYDDANKAYDEVRREFDAEWSTEPDSTDTTP
jgi:hypothetical protein